MRFTPALFVLSGLASLVVASPTNGGGGGSGSTSGGDLDILGCALTIVTECVDGLAGVDAGPLTDCLEVGLPLDPIGAATCVFDETADIISKGVDIPKGVCTQCVCSNIVDLPLGFCSSASK